MKVLKRLGSAAHFSASPRRSAPRRQRGNSISFLCTHTSGYVGALFLGRTKGFFSPFNSQINEAAPGRRALSTDGTSCDPKWNFNSMNKQLNSSVICARHALAMSISGATRGKSRKIGLQRVVDTTPHWS